MKISGIYLAAGNSSRMGCHKLSLSAGTSAVGSLALETALQSSLDNVYVVVKETDAADWIPVALKAHAKCTIIKCADSYQGQSASLRCGIQHAKDSDGTMILLADQPFITVEMIDRLIHCMKSDRSLLFAATVFGQLIAPPVLFASAMYSELMHLQGDKGARSILHGDLVKRGKLIQCSDSNALFDIDTKEQYSQFKKLAAAK